MENYKEILQMQGSYETIYKANRREFALQKGRMARAKQIRLKEEASLKLVESLKLVDEPPA